MAWAPCGDDWVSTSGGWAHRAILSPVQDRWQISLDGTLCCRSDGTAMTWPDRLQAGWRAHEFLQLEFGGPTMRVRMPWRLVPRVNVPPSSCCHGRCRRPSHCIRESLASAFGVVIMNAKLTMALQTVDGRACCDSEAAAAHVWRGEVARWLSL
jgi:hypothetical protein